MDNALRGTTVALDTAPLIYFIERHPRYIEKLRPFFAAAEGCEFAGATSWLTNNTDLPPVPGLSMLIIDELPLDSGVEVECTFFPRHSSRKASPS